MSITTTDQAVHAAIHNLAVLILKSSNQGRLVIEYKHRSKLGRMSNGVDADELIDNLAKSLGVPVGDRSGMTTHINGTPIGDEMLPELMRVIGELYLNDHRELELKNVA